MFDTTEVYYFLPESLIFCRKVLSREESEAEQAVARPQVTVIPREQHAISRKDISENALKVMYRLNKAGYEALAGWRRRARPVTWQKAERF